jgi:hypothetical protein
MTANVRKLKNISDCQIPVKIDTFTTVYLAKNESLENKEIHNLGAIRQFCEVEEDLGEVKPVKEGKIRLYG